MMGKKLGVSQIIAAVHSVYQDNFRLLQSLDYGFPEATGTFVMPDVMYTVGQLPILSGAAGVILSNQALITFMVNAIIEGDIPGLDPVSLDSDVSLLDVMESAEIRITGLQVRYRKAIVRDQSEYSFDIKFGKVKLRKNILFMKGSISLSDHSHDLDFFACMDTEPFKKFSRS